jgi:hypothetical protein
MFILFLKGEVWLMYLTLIMNLILKGLLVAIECEMIIEN